MVSGKRRRYQDTQWDLDITYITPRVVAMSFPASGMVESTYRNPISQVAKFFKERHGDKYWIFNCSERTYDKMPFNQQGSDFLWKDHHAPTLLVLFSMVKAMTEFLKQDPENVVVVHCNSGKGRTGTAIATLLLYTGFVDDMSEALTYYGWKRFSCGIGVSQPCQLRMIYYFEAALKGLVVAPCAKRLKAIVFKTVPAFGIEVCRPYFEITNNLDDNILYTSKPVVQQTKTTTAMEQQIKCYNPQTDTAMLFDFPDTHEPVIAGDVHFTFKHKGVLTDTLICRIAFNTAFIPFNNTLVFNKNTISPDGAKKDARFSDDFLVQFVFEDYCLKCNKPWSIKIEEICDECKEVMLSDISNWKTIQQIANNKPPRISLHHSEDDSEKQTILNLKLKFNSEHYKIKKSKSAKALSQIEEEYKEGEELFKGFDLDNEAIDEQYLDRENEEDIK